MRQPFFGLPFADCTCVGAQMDGPGMHYIRRSYRKQAARVAAGAHQGLDRADGGAVSQVQFYSILTTSPRVSCDVGLARVSFVLLATCMASK